MFPLLGLASVKHSRLRRFRSYGTIRTTVYNTATQCVPVYGCVLCRALHTDTPPGGASRHTTHTGHGTARLGTTDHTTDDTALHRHSEPHTPQATPERKNRCTLS